MKIFIDTAKINEIEEVFSWGIIDGVTTNPSLIKAACDEMRNKGEKIDMESYIKRILEVAKGYPVSLEVIGVNFNDTATTEIYTYDHTLSLHDALPIYR